MHGKNNNQRVVLHRDLKPDNVVLFKDDVTGQIIPKLCDLGIAKEKSFLSEYSSEG